MKLMAFFTASFLMSFTVHAGTLTPAPIDKIAGTGMPNAQGSVEFEVNYSLQPCAQKYVKVYTVELPAVAAGMDSLAIGVLIDDSGIKCMGPTFLKKETLKLVVPLSIKHVMAEPIQPGA